MVWIIILDHDEHEHDHHDGGKSHNHFEQEGLEQRQMHQYY